MNHKSRIEEYKKLREEIDNIDVYSFEDQKRLPPKMNDNPIEVHNIDDYDEDDDFYPEESKVNEDHIKKNTLSLSIDELIRKHEAYTEAIQKEELEKKIKDTKTQGHGKLKINMNIRTIAWIITSVIVLGIIIIIALVIGGVL